MAIKTSSALNTINKLVTRPTDPANYTAVETSHAGPASLYGSDVWSDGVEIYYSNSSNGNYILDKSSHQWRGKHWGGLFTFDGRYIWTDGSNIYYSYGTKQFKLNKSTETWQTMAWSGLTDLDGPNIWTDGENIYHSDYTYHSVSGGGSYYTYDTYYLEKNTFSWKRKNWDADSQTIRQGSLIWSYAGIIYHTYDSVTVFLDGNSWQPVDWFDNGYLPAQGSSIIELGGKAHSCGSMNSVFDGTKWVYSYNYWKDKAAGNLWTDGTDFYISSGTEQYKLGVNRSFSWYIDSEPRYFQYDENQTWLDWLDSKYNTRKDFFRNENYELFFNSVIYASTHNFISTRRTLNGITEYWPVNATDKISGSTNSGYPRKTIIAGTYQARDALDLFMLPDSQPSISFKSNNSVFSYMRFSAGVLKYGYSTTVYNNGKWTRDEYKTIIIEKNTGVSSEFFYWFETNYCLVGQVVKASLEEKQMVETGLTTEQALRFLTKGEELNKNIIISGREDSPLQITNEDGIIFSGVLPENKKLQIDTAYRKMYSDIQVEIYHIPRLKTPTVYKLNGYILTNATKDAKGCEILVDGHSLGEATFSGLALNWDGDVQNKTKFLDNYYKITDRVLSYAEVLNYFALTNTEEESADALPNSDGAVFITNLLCSGVAGQGCNGSTLPESGTYLFKNDTSHIEYVYLPNAQK